MDVGRRYMAGDPVRTELILEHAANLSRVFVAFSHERDPLTEPYFEATQFSPDDAGRAADGSKRSRTVPGVNGLNRVNVFSVGGKLSRLREEGSPARASRSSRSRRNRRRSRASSFLPDTPDGPCRLKTREERVCLTR